MRVTPEPGPRKGQAGFSMIEMLMTAFVLAVGLLGLALLQTMSLKATRGNKSLTTAVLVAQKILQQAEMEGRLSWLYVTNTNNPNAKLADLKSLKYITISSTGTGLAETFNANGGAVDTSSTDPAVNRPFFYAVTNQVPATAATIGNVSEMQVTVLFYDQVDKNNAQIKRTVYLSQQVTHG